MKNAAHPFMNAIIRALLGVGAFLFLLSCNSSTSLVNPDLQGTVIVNVIDASTGLPLDSVSVQFVSGSKGSTDTNGQAAFSNITAGQYFVRLDKSGYESSQAVLYAAVQGELTPVAITWSQTFGLHRKGVHLTGRVLIQTANGDTTVAAAGVTVELRDTGNDGEAYTTPLRTVKTSASGNFTFDSLPEMSSYGIDIPQFVSSGNTYSYDVHSVASSNMSVGEVYAIPLIGLTPIHSSSLQAYSSTTNLTKGQPLVVNFSSGVDTSEFGFNPIALFVTPAGSTTQTQIIANLSWNSDFTILSVTPYQSDWAAGSSYKLYLYGGAIQDLHGNTLGSTVTITASIPAVLAGLGQVQNLRLDAVTTFYTATTTFTRDTSIVDYATTPYNLKWSKVTGSEGYDIYSRSSASSEWKYFMSTGTTSSSDTTLSFSPSSPTGVAWNRNYLVLPSSSTKNVSYSLGAAISVTDQVKPVFNATGSALTNSLSTTFNNTAATPKTIQLSVTVLTKSSEPVDTTKHPTITVKEGGVLSGVGNATYVASGTFAWTGGTTGVVNMVVDPLKDGRRDTVIVDFSTVSDLAGNTFDATVTAPVLKYATP